MDKIQFYEYVDIIDTRKKLEEIERKGKKEDRYSWSILVDELKTRVIDNIFINDFIKKINKSIKFSDIYYNTINKYIDDTMDVLNTENNDFFYDLQRHMLIYYLDHEGFYNLQKNKIYQEITIINKLYIKLNETSDINKIKLIKNIIYKNLEIFEKRQKILRLIIKKNNISSYSDDFIININANDNNNDILKYFEFMKYNNRVYNNVLLPKVIKIKETPLRIILYNEINYKNNITEYHYILTTFLNILNLKKYIKYMDKDKESSTKLILKNINNYLFKQKRFFNVDKSIFIYYHCTTLTKRLNVYILNIKYIPNHYFDKWRKKHKPWSNRVWSLSTINPQVILCQN